MYLIVAQMLGDPEAQCAGSIEGMLSRTTFPSDGLEHVYVEPTTQGSLLAMFFIAPTLRSAESTARRLCGRMLRTHTGLTGWRLGQVVGVEGIM